LRAIISASNAPPDTGPETASMPCFSSWAWRLRPSFSRFS